MNQRLFSFIGSNTGPWTVTAIHAVCGESLAAVDRIEMVAGDAGGTADAAWILRGATSNERYVIRTEKDRLVEKQQGLGRPQATRAALIPLRKNDAWWALTQDERREIFEAQSTHIRIGMKYLPAIARRLHHCRDLTSAEPFDFLTWFEYAPSDESAFNDLLHELRSSPEWRYVDREVDLRLIRHTA